MATAALAQDHSEALGADVVDNVLLIEVGMIDRVDRLREIDEAHARALGEVMARDGQNTPIEVCRLPGADRWTLVAGAHRHRGAELKGIAYLRAIVVSADEDDRRLREASENVWHRGLDPIDRAAHVAALVAIKKRRAGIDPKADGRVVGAAARWQKEVKDEAADATVTMTVAYGLTDELAAEIGFSPSKIERDLYLYRRVAPSLVARLRAARHPVATNASQLRQLAKLEPAEQARAVDALLLTETVKSVGDAIATIRGSNRAIDPEAKRLSTFIGTFGRMSLAEKKGALAELRALLPAGFTIHDGPLPKANISAQHEQYREDALTALDRALLFIEGLIEDDVDLGDLTGDRASEMDGVAGDLRMTRFTIAGNGFALGGDA